MKKILLVSFLVTGALAACGADKSGKTSTNGKQTAKAAKEEDSPQLVDALRVAYKKTSSEGSARVEFTNARSGIPTGETTNGEAQEGEFRITGSGVAGLDGKTSRLNMEMDALGSIEVRQIGNTMYQKMPRDMTAGVSGMKPWVSMNLDSFYEDQLGASLSELKATNPTDPTRQLKALKDAGSVKKIGAEKVRGASTTHYRAVMDLEKAAREGGPDVQKAYDKMIEQMGTSKLPTEVWLDDEGRVRRFQMETKTKVPVSDPATGETSEVEITTKMTQEMFDFGAPINVSPPPPKKTMTQQELEQLMSQSQQQPAPAPTT